jgi:hypothetical protein
VREWCHFHFKFSLHWPGTTYRPRIVPHKWASRA